MHDTSNRISKKFGPFRRMRYRAHLPQRRNPRRFIILIGILVVTWVWSSYLSSLVFTLFGGVLDEGSICLALQVRCTP